MTKNDAVERAKMPKGSYCPFCQSEDIDPEGVAFYPKGDKSNGLKNAPACNNCSATSDKPFPIRAAMTEDTKSAIDFCAMVEEIGMPDDTVIPVWPIETEMVITHPLTVGMVKMMAKALLALQTSRPDANRTRREELEAAFLAGWEISGEGYNHEHHNSSTINIADALEKSFNKFLERQKNGQ